MCYRSRSAGCAGSRVLLFSSASHCLGHRYVLVSFGFITLPDWGSSLLIYIHYCQFPLFTFTQLFSLPPLVCAGCLTSVAIFPNCRVVASQPLSTLEVDSPPHASWDGSAQGVFVLLSCWIYILIAHPLHTESC